MNIEFDTGKFEKEIGKKTSEIKKNLPKALKQCCELVRSTILDDMAKTQVNPDVSYYTHNKNTPHHPSLPGNPPAPDSGMLRSSIHYTVEEENNETVGIIGTDLDYGRMLELGTSRIAPRPWLKPAIQKCDENIKKIIKEAMK